MREIWCILLVGLLNFTAFGQKVDKCEHLVKNYLKKMSIYANPDPSKVYYLKMSTEAKYRPNSEYKDSRVDVTVIINGPKVQYESQYMNFYMDQDESYTVLHPQRLIVKGDGGAKNRTDKFGDMVSLHDTLLKHSQLVSCVEINQNSRLMKVITFKTDKLFEKATSISRVEYTYDLKEERVFKAVTFFSPSSIKKMEIITYSELSYDYKKSPFNDASEMIFATKGNLVSRFKNYEIIDNRNFLNK